MTTMAMVMAMMTAAAVNTHAKKPQRLGDSSVEALAPPHPGPEAREPGSVNALPAYACRIGLN